MRLAFHGGMCCGIKTIYELGFPNDTSPPLTKKDKDNSDVGYSAVKPTHSFFTDAAPKETNLERLDRFIAFCKERRPAHIIEVTLADDPNNNYNAKSEYIGYTYQTKMWGKILTDHGFKKVTEGKNSNSGNVVSVWHLTYDLTATGKKEEAVAYEPDGVEEVS